MLHKVPLRETEKTKGRIIQACPAKERPSEKIGCGGRQSLRFFKAEPCCAAYVCGNFTLANLYYIFRSIRPARVRPDLFQPRALRAVSYMYLKEKTS
ncbi:hypothetical protein HMPREF9120_01977 [Neisseria sp. oral taxon 020 str. F0370]|nr:hypothetical protein HMPREF9120_01977 [Neisseria sp. oral taxon 020 str. F0370]